MAINYDAVRLVHRVEAILLDSERDRRLEEVRRCTYRDPRCRALVKILTKKSGMSTTELDILRDFPDEGILLGNVSNALIFADALHHLSIPKHKAIVSLLRQRALAIVEGYHIDRDVSCGRVQVLVKL